MGRIFKEAVVAGAKTSVVRRVLIDNGAESSYLSPSLARRIGAKPTGNVVSVVGVGGQVIRSPEVRVDIVMPRTGCMGRITAFLIPGERVGIGADALQAWSADLHHRPTSDRISCPVRVAPVRTRRRSTRRPDRR